MSPNTKLDPIDRWYSEPLDVHVWSHHPEIRELTNTLYDELGIARLESKSNNKGKISLKGMLRVLLLDLYVRWLKDPNLSTGFSKATRHYKPNSRSNALHINRNIILVEKTLEDQGYLEVLPHYNDRTGAGRSYTTRIRPSERLTDHFNRLTIELHDIDKHHKEDCIILREKFYDEEDNRSTMVDIEYEDNDYTNTIRGQLSAYNELLKNTFIDIPSFTKPHFSRLITKGKRAGQKTTISMGLDNKFVRRVFSGGLQGDWKLRVMPKSW